ncbi:MAG: antitoxin family protein [Abitibacteriaceae bacterium]|nr:antitoxin family protein [Abditibacteriaceae bacterium]MBV9867697.1 antitoxin family protein [Abditibacteriaceae bacterium]
MVQILEAVFDGEVLHPDEPLDLEPNTRVRLVIETVSEAESKPASFLRTVRSLNLEGPADWSTNLDTYLYGDEVQRGG